MDQREATPAAGERYRQLIETAPAGIMQVDVAGRIVEANAETCRLFGYAREHLIGAPVELLVPEDRREAHARHRATEELGPHRRIDARPGLAGRRKDGTRFPVEIGLSVVDTREGRLTTVVVLDVTELSGIADLGLAAASEYKEQFDITARAAIDGLWDWRISENVIWWNARYAEMFGYSLDTMPPDFDAWQEKVHPDDRDRVNRSIADALKGTATSWSAEYRFLRADGTYAYAFDRADIQRDEAGTAIRMTGSMVDLSPIKAAEAALAQQAQTYRTLLANVRGVVYRCRNDAEWTMTYVSGGCRELTGFRPTDFVDGEVTYGALIHPDDRDWLWEVCRASIAAGRPCSNEYRIRTRDGEERWVWDQAEAVRDEGGTVVAIEGLITDITDRRRAETDRAEVEERYRTLVEHIPAITYIEVADPESPFGYRDVYVSPQIETILGYTPEEWVEQDAFWSKAVHPDDLDELITVAHHAMTTGAPYETEFRMLHQDGHTIWVHDEAFEVRSEGHDPYWHGIMYDITDEREAREARIAAETAGLASRAKSEFLSRVSHELRTPLNAILGFAQLMRMDELSTSHGESVDQILTAGQHLLGLVDEILDISRIEAGDMTLDIRTTPAMEAVREMAALVQPLADERRVEVLVQDPGPGLEVWADTRRLRQILLNLLSNAVKYNREGGTVSIAGTTEPDQVRIDITDTGPGMTEDELARVFAPFDRLEASASSVEGTGLGLSVSRGLAEAMGGSLAAVSTPGVGSTFTLLLPAPSGTTGTEGNDRALGPLAP